MTDPIEQARPAGRWNEKHSYWRLPDGLYFMLPDSVEQAILRYHPDVVRLVEAARRAEWVQGFYEESGHLFWSCPDCGAEADWRGNGRIAGKHEPDCTLAAALVPFTTEEESE